MLMARLLARWRSPRCSHAHLILLPRDGGAHANAGTHRLCRTAPRQEEIVVGAAQLALADAQTHRHGARDDFVPGRRSSYQPRARAGRWAVDVTARTSAASSGRQTTRSGSLGSDRL